MNPISIITGAVGTVFGGIKDIIMGHVQNDADKISAGVELGKLQMQLNDALINVQAQIITAASTNIQAEANSTSWLAKDWRPMLMLGFGGLVCWVIIGGVNMHGVPISPDDRAWLFRIVFSGVTGYVAEPVVTKAIAAWKGNGNGNGKTDA